MSTKRKTDNPRMQKPAAPTCRNLCHMSTKIKMDNLQLQKPAARTARNLCHMSTKIKMDNLQLQKPAARTARNPYQLPPKYKTITVVGEGSFGKVLKCVNKDTNSVVAIKIPKYKQCCKKEVDALKRLMFQNLDEHNIVKFHESFEGPRGEALVFENLELSVEEFIMNSHRSMLLRDIRTIIKQVAIALNALKSIGLIHTDIKPDNIMLVEKKRPLRVKLIDFGLCIDKSKVRPGMILQTVNFRSPEILLGLPFNESIDMWSVGCVLFTMLYSSLLFDRVEYNTLQLMIDLLGQPSQELLNQGRWTAKFFVKTKSNDWRIMTPYEYWGKRRPSMDCKRPFFSSLDDLKKFRKKRKPTEWAELEQSIELMKAMLQMDQKDRITPTEVLHHPFITRKKSCIKKIKSSIRKMKTVEKNINPPPPDPQSGVIPLRPPAAHGLQQSDRHVKSGVKITTSTHPEHHSPPHTVLPSGLILVRPASSANTMKLEEEEIPVSLHAKDTETPPSPDDDRKEEKKKKKKNCFQRLRSWFNKKFFCNRVGVM